jgi:guanylate kinase
VLGRFPEAVTIFILPGDLAELERRLRSRGTESEEAIERRLSVAQHELQRADRYRYQVVNETVAGAVAEISHILKSRGLKND